MGAMKKSDAKKSVAPVKASAAKKAPVPVKSKAAAAKKPARKSG